MTGESGAHGEVGGFFIANLADNERLGVLPQLVPCGFGEVESNGVVDLSLHDAGHDLFDRVFDGDDVASTVFGELTETGVDGGGFTAASRPGEEHQASGLTEKSFNLNACRLWQSQLVNGFNGGGIEQAENDFLTSHGRITRYADVMLATHIGVFDAAILRQRILIGLEPCEEFDATEHALCDSRREIADGCDHAIETECDLGGFLPHLEVDVARASALRL